MDLDAVRRVMRRTSEVLPAWLQWRQDTLLAQSRFAGEAETAAAARRMAELWQRNLADVSEAEAGEVLDRIAVGQLTAPMYGELPVWLRRESLALRPTAEAERRELQYAAEPRFRCLHCRDTGVVHCLDADFVTRFRTRFAAMTDEDFADTTDGTWWHRAKAWHRAEHGTAKIEYAAACDCPAGLPRRERQRSWQPDRMPVLHGLWQVRDTLFRWYDVHPPGGAEFWAEPAEAACTAK